MPTMTAFRLRNYLKYFIKCTQTADASLALALSPSPSPSQRGINYINYSKVLRLMNAQRQL